MKSGRNQIEQFLEFKKLAIVGASRDPKKFGTEVLRHLLKLDYELAVVHPVAEEIESISCVKGINMLPDDIEGICIITPKDQTDKLLAEALEKGIKQVWIQQFSESDSTFDIISNSDANIVTGRCIFMYTKPTGIHKFHERFTKFFGVYPR